MKRYLVFEWHDYEALGGLNDLINSYDSKTYAVKIAKKLDSWTHPHIEVIDTNTKDLETIFEIN